MVGLTRFLFLMKDCEKSAVSSNVYAGFRPVEKDADFRGVKKLFSLQENPASFRRRRGCEIFVARETNFQELRRSDIFGISRSDGATDLFG